MMPSAALIDVLWMHLALENRVACLVTEGVTFASKPHFLVRMGMSLTIVTTGHPVTTEDKSGSMRVVPRSDCTASREMDMRTFSRIVTGTHSSGDQNFKALLAGITLGDKVWRLDLEPSHLPILRLTAQKKSGTVHIGHQCAGGGVA